MEAVTLARNVTGLPPTDRIAILSAVAAAAQMLALRTWDEMTTLLQAFP
jgi:hypothetical protein